MNLDDIRINIDNIDDQIARLFEKRMTLAKQVGIFKSKNTMPISNRLREKEIINRVTSGMSDDIKIYAKQVYNILFEVSKAYQLKFVDIESEFKSSVKKAIDSAKPFPTSSTVACQGTEGAYSSLATDKLFPISNIMYFKDFDNVFTAVENGLCDFGVLPIENSSVGSVNGVYDLMRKHKFFIVKSVKYPIGHYLLGKKGSKLADIKEVISHEQAIAQSREYLSKMKNIKITTCTNTAVGAKFVSESDSASLACISSKECADIYGLEILASAIQDNDNNYTRFIAISKKMEIYTNCNKISIMVDLTNETGSLNTILNKFSALHLNLTKLESRPKGGNSFEFSFYFDFDADIKKEEVQNLLSELSSSNENFVFLGSFQEVN